MPFIEKQPSEDRRKEGDTRSLRSGDSRSRRTFTSAPGASKELPRTLADQIAKSGLPGIRVFGTPLGDSLHSTTPTREPHSETSSVPPDISEAERIRYRDAVWHFDLYHRLQKGPPPGISVEQIRYRDAVWHFDLYHRLQKDPPPFQMNRNESQTYEVPLNDIEDQDGERPKASHAALFGGIINYNNQIAAFSQFHVQESDPVGTLRNLGHLYDDASIAFLYGTPENVSRNTDTREFRDRLTEYVSKSIQEMQETQIPVDPIHLQTAIKNLQQTIEQDTFHQETLKPWSIERSKHMEQFDKLRHRREAYAQDYEYVKNSVEKEDSQVENSSIKDIKDILRDVKLQLFRSERVNASFWNNLMESDFRSINENLDLCGNALDNAADKLSNLQRAQVIPGFELTKIRDNVLSGSPQNPSAKRLSAARDSLSSKSRPEVPKQIDEGVS